MPRRFRARRLAMQMLPRPTTHKVANRLSGYTVFRSDSLVRHAGFGKHQHTLCVGSGETCEMRRFTETMPTLADHVSVIVGRSADEQVAEIDARRIVAGVAEGRAIGDRAVGQFPCESVSKDRAALVDGEHAVSLAITGTGPLPASNSNRHHRAESQFRRAGVEAVATSNSTKSAVRSNLPRRKVKILAAVKAWADGTIEGHSGRLLGRLIGVPCRRLVTQRVGFRMPQLYREIGQFGGLESVR